MNDKKDILLLYFLIFIELLILVNSKDVINSVIHSSIIFITNIFPSLFPTMVIGSFLIKNNVSIIIPKFIKIIFNKLFYFDDNMTSIFVISMFTGTPSNALFINDYVEKKLLTDKQAETLLCCTHFINPLFVIGGVGISVFESFLIGILLLFLIYLSNFFKAFLVRKKDNYGSCKKNIYYKNNLIITFQESIFNSIRSLLTIFGIIIMFNILVNLLCNIFNFSNITNCIVNGFLEMTGGIIKLKNINIHFVFKFVLAYFFLSFGGFCIQMQAFSMIIKRKIRYVKYLIFRLF